MGQVLVRNLDDDVIELLKRRAELQGKSLEQHLRDILVEKAKPSREEVWKEIDEFRARIKPSNLDLSR